MTATFGPEFLLNTATFGSQAEGLITALADGRFVATWTDFAGEFDDLFGGVIKAQLLTPMAARPGPSFWQPHRLFAANAILGHGDGGWRLCRQLDRRQPFGRG